MFTFPNATKHSAKYSELPGNPRSPIPIPVARRVAELKSGVACSPLGAIEGRNRHPNPSADMSNSMKDGNGVVELE